MKGCHLPMETFFLKFFVSLILIALFQSNGCKGCMENERISLLKIKSFFISVSDKEYADNILTSWVDDSMSDCCGWKSVQCNATTRQVMELSLNNTRQSNYYDGFLPLNFSLFLPFRELQSLDLSKNYFEGWEENKATYDSFGSLKQLKMLNLGDNYFNDSVLPYLTTLTSLTTLILGWNRIEGLKPNQGFANLTKLKVLDLSGNRINISTTELGLANLINLEELYLRDNGINGLAGLTNLIKLKVLDLSWNKINESTTWQGICELKNLVGLDLTRNNFTGGLPQCLHNLTSLKVFDISFNQLSGNLPSVIANLTSLEYLDISYNNFEGIFSLSSLVNHSKLEVFLLSTQNNRLQLKTENWLPTFQLKVFHLSYCNFNGTIPSFLLHQYDLKFLDISHNKLVGNFPTWLLQNNTKLEVLVLRNNSFTGILQLPNSKYELLHLDLSSNNFTEKLPQNMGTTFPKLKYIDISRNSFEGNIPSSIAEMKGLSLMDFSRNKFSGELSEPIFPSCISLLWLDLSENNFYGKIFPIYANLTKLQWLYLDNNHFTGKIKDKLLNSTALSVLDISNNKLSGHIPSWIGNLSGLKVLLMYKNRLEGSIPVQLNNLERLAILDVSENNLFGSIASSLNLSLVEHIYMQKNALGGLIPNFLFKSSKLMTLDLRDNYFSGRIPHQIKEYSDLRVLLLGGNQLQGQIPNQLCQLQKLGILDLSRNRLNGSIPSCFKDVLFWKVGNDDLYGSDIKYSSGLDVGSIGTYYNTTLYLGRSRGEIDRVEDQRVELEFVTKNRYEFYNGRNLNYMAGLDLSCNELTEEIPLEIVELQKIRALNLSHNFLSGSIPKSFSKLKMIESLDLSHNRLSGQIPLQLIELNYLSTFNVSYNNLTGQIPDKAQFATFTDSSYIGNLGLCGETINKSCITIVEEIPTPTFNGGEEDETAIDMVSFIWSFGASFVIFVLGLFAILWVNSYWRKLWFFFIEACIDRCNYWLLKFVYFIRDHAW